METGSWAIGPGLVLVHNVGAFVLGGLFSQYWNFSDHGGDPKTNLFVMQPFVNFNFGKGWALAFAPLLTANWDADSQPVKTLPSWDSSRDWRADVVSDQYPDWLVKNDYIITGGMLQATAFLETFVEYPPSQRPASFSIDQVRARVDKKIDESFKKRGLE